MAADIDPQLKQELERAGDDGEVEAVILVQASLSASGEDIVDVAAKKINEEPSKVKTMPSLGAIFVRGSGKLLRTILEREEVVSATSTGGDIHKA